MFMLKRAIAADASHGKVSKHENEIAAVNTKFTRFLQQLFELKHDIPEPGLNYCFEGVKRYIHSL